MRESWFVFKNSTNSHASGTTSNTEMDPCGASSARIGVSRKANEFQKYWRHLSWYWQLKRFSYRINKKKYDTTKCIKGETAVSFKHKPHKVLSSTSLVGKINESILFFLTTCIKAESKHGDGGNDNDRRRRMSYCNTCVNSVWGINSGELDRRERYWLTLTVTLTTVMRDPHGWTILLCEQLRQASTAHFSFVSN